MHKYCQNRNNIYHLIMVYKKLLRLLNRDEKLKYS